MSKPGNAAAVRIARFFTENPNEWLTADDIALKFGVDREWIRHHMRKARALSKGIRIERELVYFGVPVEPAK